MTAAGRLRGAAVAAAAGGVLWLGLVPALALKRGGDVSYAGLYRLAALPLLAFFLAWALLRPALPGPRSLFGWSIVLLGLGFAFAGVALEFWGAWILDEPAAAGASQRGSDAWWGSRVGWSLHLLGFLVLCGGGPTTGVGLRREGAWPMWACTFVTVLGVGVMLVNVLHDADAAPAAVGIGAFAAGWLALAVRVWRLASARPKPLAE